MAVQEKTENRRTHDRAIEPAIRLKIDSKIYRSVNWSLGGFLIEGYEGGLSTGSLMLITEIGLSRGAMTPVKVRGRVIRAEAGASLLAIQVLEIDQSAYAILQKLMVNKTQRLKSQP